MKLLLRIATASPEVILEIIDGIKNAYPGMEVLNKDINWDDACSAITVEVEDKDAFVELIKSENDNHDLDSWIASGHLYDVIEADPPYTTIWDQNDLTS
jgi:hypothetical protein